MTLQEHRELEHYKCQLRRDEQTWHSRLRLYADSDRFAVDIGLVVLRTAILVNAGALVALLAFAGQLWTPTDTVALSTLHKILGATNPFGWGVILAALGGSAAYFYQSFETERRERHWNEVSEGGDSLPPQKVYPKLRGACALLMIGLITAAYVMFIIGTLGARSALAG